MQLIEGLAAAAVLVVGDVTDRIVDEDPDDDAVLACSFDGRADYVVTGDQHLLALGAVRGIRIVRPRQFLDALPST
jgi:predicted nucleic acid-binding protein